MFGKVRHETKKHDNDPVRLRATFTFSSRTLPPLPCRRNEIIMTLEPPSRHSEHNTTNNKVEHNMDFICVRQAKKVSHVKMDGFFEKNR